LKGKKRLAAFFRFSITGIMDTGLIQVIVELKLRMGTRRTATGL
jgi:hypothetical protein